MIYGLYNFLKTDLSDDNKWYEKLVFAGYVNSYRLFSVSLHISIIQVILKNSMQEVSLESV